MKTIKGILGLIAFVLMFGALLSILHILGQYDNVNSPDWENDKWGIGVQVNYWGDTTYQVWIQEEEQSKWHPYGDPHVVHNAHYIPITEKDTCYEKID